MEPKLTFDLDRLLLNGNQIKKITRNIFKEQKVKIFYAIKANSDEPVLSSVFKQGIGAEVLSLRELELVPNHVEVIVNGHSKGTALIEAALKRESCTFMVESVEELRRIEEYIKLAGISIKPNIGVRVSVSDKARIGLPLTDLHLLDEWIKPESTLRINTLHLHAGWNVKEDEKVHKMLSRMNIVHEYIQKKGGRITCWNFGGSFAEASSYPQQLQKRLQLYHRLLPENVSEVYFEPGRYLVGDCGKLEAQVIEVRSNQTIINSATYGYMLSGATAKLKYVLKGEKNEKSLLLNDAESENQTVLSGIWPSENDCLNVSYSGRSLEIGDTIYFENMGAYLASSMRSLSDEELLTYQYQSKLINLWQNADDMQQSLLLRFWCFNIRQFKTLPKKLIELEKILQLISLEFQPGTLYTENEVNEVLLQYNLDFCTLRRDLVEQKFLHRQEGAKVVYERIV